MQTKDTATEDAGPTIEKSDLERRVEAILTELRTHGEDAAPHIRGLDPYFVLTIEQVQEFVEHACMHRLRADRLDDDGPAALFELYGVNGTREFAEQRADEERAEVEQIAVDLIRESFRVRVSDRLAALGAELATIGASIARARASFAAYTDEQVPA